MAHADIKRSAVCYTKPSFLHHFPNGTSGAGIHCHCSKDLLMITATFVNMRIPARG